MANKRIAVVLEAKVAWWGWAYLYGVYFLAALLDREPDDAKVARVLNRAITVKVCDRMDIAA